MPSSHLRYGRAIPFKFTGRPTDRLHKRGGANKRKVNKQNKRGFGAVRRRRPRITVKIPLPLQVGDPPAGYISRSQSGEGSATLSPLVSPCTHNRPSLGAPFRILCRAGRGRRHKSARARGGRYANCARRYGGRDIKTEWRRRRESRKAKSSRTGT